MAEQTIPKAIDTLNQALKGKGEAGAQLAVNRVLAAGKCPIKPSVSKGTLEGVQVRFYDYGKVKCFGNEQLILVSGPSVEAHVVLGSEIATGQNGIYLKTQSDSKAQSDADARASKASQALKAPPPKRAPAPPKPAPAVPPARRTAAARALKAESARETTPAVEVVVVPEAPKHRHVMAPRYTSAFNERRIGARRATDESRSAGVEGSYMSPAAERAEHDRIAREAAKADQQAKGMAEAQQLIAALRAMKKGG